VSAALEIIATDQKPKNHKFHNIDIAEIYIIIRFLFSTSGNFLYPFLNTIKITIIARINSKTATPHLGNEIFVDR
ncbi:hypothetical protein, partial [Bacillus thuringiensis]|uniref:hypothetical protein n=1 Tax=Bacillus thuringiensis TaxID=1428 RepID=UPI001C3F2EA6